jgi:predicted small lipoprotein YifL
MARSWTMPLLALLIALLLGPALAACGKKAPLEPPPDQPNVFPRSYPHE